jgi:hypothetical protein
MLFLSRRKADWAFGSSVISVVCSYGDAVAVMRAYVRMRNTVSIPWAVLNVDHQQYSTPNKKKRWDGSGIEKPTASSGQSVQTGQQDSLAEWFVHNCRICERVVLKPV